MRVETCLLVAAALALAPAPLLAQQPGQPPQQPSVAEAARHARQAQKQAPKNVKLYTNDNLPRGSGGFSVVGAEAPPPQAAQPEKPGSREAPKKPAAPEEKGPADWRSRFAAARAQLAQAESDLAALEREMQRLQLQYYADPNKAMVQGYTRSDIHEQQARIAAKQNEIARLRDALRQLEDEFRRAGGEPGWVR